MAVFKTKAFARFADDEAIPDRRLREAAERAECGLIDADLGGGLIKQRVARRGQGKRGGYRTLMAFRAGTHTVFLYAFAKSERDNIRPEECQFWRQVASEFLTTDQARFKALLATREIMEVTDDD